MPIKKQKIILSQRRNFLEKKFMDDPSLCVLLGGNTQRVVFLFKESFEEIQEKGFTYITAFLSAGVSV